MPTRVAIKKPSSVDKVSSYVSTGALVAAAMLIPFAAVGAAQAVLDIGDAWSVFCFLVAGLLTARAVGALLFARRRLP
jgi:hypothetical protein